MKILTLARRVHTYLQRHPKLFDSSNVCRIELTWDIIGDFYIYAQEIKGIFQVHKPRSENPHPGAQGTLSSN
jgi:hypothetical protein